ncbi:MAG: metallophosphoesterase [Deltaproteobacteria bacterium]|nr:metallophosphoesterase [Deltaproteobacteria bacterium]
MTEWSLPVKGLENPIYFAHLPDLHLGPARGEGYLKRVLDTVVELKPDFILYNGDLVDGNSALTTKIFDNFKDLTIPQYFTTGNHEFYVNTSEEINLLNYAGIRVLRSQSIEVNGINLIGLEYMNADKESSDAHQVNNLMMDEELPKIPTNPNYPTLLAHHSPVGIKYAVREKIDVYVSGHTHGGQVFPGTLLASLRYPYLKGYFQIDGLQLLVSQGVGTFGPVMRLGTFNEIQMIKLVPSQ